MRLSFTIHKQDRNTRTHSDGLLYQHLRLDKVGMPLGAVPMFLQLVEDEVNSHATKRRRLDNSSSFPLDQENVTPTA